MSGALKITNYNVPIGAASIAGVDVPVGITTEWYRNLKALFDQSAPAGVTSVGLSMPGIFAVTNSPVISVGTLTAALNTQAANLVFAGPATGADATPTFRALVTADLPSFGLQYWIEARSSSGTNATVNVSSFTPNAASTNAHAAIVPKGTGGILAAVPDGSSAGGNARGTNAVDLQTKRSGATQVASAVSSTVGGGTNNRSDEQEATVGGGYNNANSGLRATIPGGADITITSAGSYAFASGNSITVSALAASGVGSGHTVSGAYGHAVGSGHTVSGEGGTAQGVTCVSNAAYSFAAGYKAHTFSVIGARAFASGNIASDGDSQEVFYTIRGTTVNSTPTPIGTTTSSINYSNQVRIPNTAGTVAFFGQLTAFAAATGDCARWQIDGLARMYAGTPSIIGSTVTQIYSTAGAVLWNVGISADVSAISVAIAVTGAAATPVRWSGGVWTVQQGT
jgi:hypothetical protein